ncbi:MAG: hypothetical protein FWD66_09265 [Paludibacter sp.]|nr:hypothetical protein [Paludibacter sp.]
MKKNIIYILFIFNILPLILNAQKANSNTTYKKGIFSTEVTCSVESVQKNVNQVVNDFIWQYKFNLNALFGWALKDVKLHGEQDNFIEFDIKSHSFENQIVNGKMDIAVKLLGKKYTDVAYKVKIEKIKDTQDLTEISYFLYDCEEVINQAQAKFSITRLDTNSYEIKLIAQTQLKKFYNTLMTQKMFRQNIEWRFRKFVENMAKKMSD